MDVIDSDWIKKRLTGRRGEKAALARAIGIRPDQVSKILKGERAVTASEIPRVIAFFSEQPLAPRSAHDLMAFAEPDAEEYEAGTKGRARDVMRLLAPQAKSPATYLITKPLSCVGLIPGDIAIVDLGATPSDGDTVACTVADTDSGASYTEIRRYFAPWLLPGALGATPLTLDDSQKIAILGVVCASYRAPQMNDRISPKKRDTPFDPEWL